MFSLSAKVINTDSARRELQDARAGALATFEGWVRNHNDGMQVRALSYEAFDTLCIKEGERIIEEAREKFDVYSASCIHRTGDLQIGDIAVWVGAIAAHRGTAFDACRYIIDEIKLRLPIWKKETYFDGRSEWVNCSHHGCSQPAMKPHAATNTPPDESEYYSKQTALDGVGHSGQERLRAARVLVIGAGGLGSPALLFLAGAGVGTIGICDDDRVSIDNLHRQILYGTADIGAYKTTAAAKRLRALNPFISVVEHCRRFDASTAESLFENYDFVLDCSDNFETKFLANDTAIRLHKTLVQASIYQFEGQLHMVQAAAGGHYGQCLRCLWPKVSPSATELSCIGSCAEVGVLGAVPGTLGTMQAHETIKLILGMESPLLNHVVFFDLCTLNTRQVRRIVQEGCTGCSGSAPTAQAPDSTADESEYNKTYEQALANSELIVVDIRDESEIAASPIQTQRIFPAHEVRHWPAATVLANEVALCDQAAYLFVCQRGIRSKNLVRQLRDQSSCKNLFSLIGGISNAEIECRMGAGTSGERAK